MEQDIAPALEHLQDETATWGGRLSFIPAALFSGPSPDRFAPHLERLGLDQPQSLKDRLMRKLVLKALGDTSGPRAPTPREPRPSTGSG